jgi:2-oxoisovalerate dehydrogenase E1 component
VAVAFVGEGASSLGEWHEAINICAARRLPAIFCVQNNQTALSTRVHDQSAVRVFADKAEGYGVPGVTIDGTDPEAVAATFAWAAQRARDGKGPTLIETVSMRMCGHAHHDDMLYLGRDPHPSWDYPEVTDGGYADRDAYAFWSPRDPIANYARRLEADGVLDEGELEQMKQAAEARVSDETRRVIDGAWPDPHEAGIGVFDSEAPRRHIEVLEDRPSRVAGARRELPPLDPGPPVDPKGKTLLEAVMLGVGDALGADDRAFVYGQDVGGSYGNAFLLLRPLLERYGDRIVNAPLCEGGILGVCIGSALAGMRPIGEIQFNDFVATGFNQLVNSAAKIRYRWGGSVPMVVRLPWGGLRRAGPYHSQNTEPWFYRTPGLKIVAPSTPYDARALMAAAVADPDPVLYYEHIGLYRNPKIKQLLSSAPPAPLPIGTAALRREGSDLALISYGAYVHVCLQVAESLAADGIEAAVLDLRSLAPLDREASLRVARHCGKVLIAHEDSRTGGIGESLAAIIQEEAFEDLDAPVRIVGALDTPVPYSPPLEDEFLPGFARVERAARLLAGY